MDRDRGQSISINYTLSLVIVSVLMSGLFISMSGFLDTERTRVTRSEFEVLGNRVAADIATADRLAETTESNAGVEVETAIPPRVAGSWYTVTITSQPAGSGQFVVEIQLDAREVDVSKNVSTKTEFEVVNSRLTGGSYVVSFDGSTLGVSDA